MATINIPETLEDWNQRGELYLPGLLGMEVTVADKDKVSMRMTAEKSKMAWNGFLHAGAIVSLADTACGYGTLLNLPEGARGFTTVELKSNFLGTALEGFVIAEAKPVHAGRTTQLWDAEVFSENTGKRMAVFRCTQIILYPQV